MNPAPAPFRPVPLSHRSVPFGWMPLFLLACSWIVTGGLPPAAMAQQATDAPIDVEWTAQDDRALASGLRKRLQQIKGTEKVQVEVTAGVVTLNGTVLSDANRAQAVAIAERVDGVVFVQDDIEVVVSPTERLQPAMDDAVERLQTLLSYLPLLALSLVLFFVFVLVARFAGRQDRLYERLATNRFARDLLRQAVKTAILLTGLLIVLELLDATALVSAVLGTAGVIGLALGFAFKDLVENYIASILLSVRQPFEPNDFVRIDDHEGKVIRLTSRATVLMTLDGNHLRLPNSKVFKGVILNFSRNPQRRFDFGVGVGVNEDLEEAQDLGIHAMRSLPGILDDPEPMALIENLGDSNVLLRFYGWVDQREHQFSKVKSAAIRRVKTILEDAGMDLPEPIYRVHLSQPLSSAPSVADSSNQEPSSSKPHRGFDDGADDTSVDDYLERQIEADRGDPTSEENLLRPGGPVE